MVNDAFNKAVEDRHAERAVFEEPAILINLNQHYQPNIDARSLYEVTRSFLKIDTKRVNNIKIACAVYRGFIKEVYVVSRWMKAEERDRYYFEGEIAPEDLRKKYLGKSVASYWVRDNQSIIKYALYEVNGIKHES